MATAATTATPATRRIDANALKTFPKAVRDVVTEAVNEHGVTFRVIDGGHIRLFCGDRSVIPAKINDNSPEQHILRKLLPWLEANVPTWSQREMKPETLATLKEAVDSTPTGPETEVATAKPEWVEYKWGFETDGTTFRCTTKGCTYTRTDPRGLHLHYWGHNGKATEMSIKAGETQKLRRQQEHTLITQALTVLAEIHDVDLSGGTKEVEALKGKVAALEARVTRLTEQNERLKVERDEAKTRLALVQEAMRA